MRNAPDLVRCKLGPPGLDGFAVAAALRADPRMAGARLNALTGYGQDKALRRCQATGFSDRLRKPVDVPRQEPLPARPPA